MKMLSLLSSLFCLISFNNSALGQDTEQEPRYLKLVNLAWQSDGGALFYQIQNNAFFKLSLNRGTDSTQTSDEKIHPKDTSFSVSKTGKHSIANRNIVITDTQEKIPLPKSIRIYGLISWSNHGESIAYTGDTDESVHNVFVFNLKNYIADFKKSELKPDDHYITQISEYKNSGHYPQSIVWSPSDAELAYNVYSTEGDRKYFHRLFIKNLGNTKEPATLVSDHFATQGMNWVNTSSPMRKLLIYGYQEASKEIKGGWAIYSIDLETRKTTQLAEQHPHYYSVSNDGAFLVMGYKDDAQDSVPQNHQVQDLKNGKAFKISGLMSEARFSPNGQELAFIHGVDFSIYLMKTSDFLNLEKFEVAEMVKKAQRLNASKEVVYFRPSYRSTPTKLGNDFSFSTPKVTESVLNEKTVLSVEYEVTNTSDKKYLHLGFSNAQQVGYLLKNSKGELLADGPHFFQPSGSSLLLSPLEKHTVSLRVPKPEKASKGEKFQVTIYLLGYKEESARTVEYSVE